MDLLSQIATNTYTISSLKKRVRILREFFERKFFGGSSNPLTTEDQNWVASLPQQLTVLLNKDNLYNLFDHLTKQIDEIKPLVVYVAFDLPNTEVTALAQKVRGILNSPLTFLEIKKDLMLICGAAFVYKGVYKDYSIKSRIEKDKERILTEFRRSLG